MRRVRVRVTPRASKDEVVGWEGDLLRVRLRAPPVDGAANESLRNLLVGFFKVRRSQVTLVRGDKSRIKTVEIQGVNGTNGMGDPSGR